MCDWPAWGGVEKEKKRRKISCFETCTGNVVKYDEKNRRKMIVEGIDRGICFSREELEAIRQVNRNLLVVCWFVNRCHFVIPSIVF